MTNRDIINYVSFRTDLEQLINRYIADGLPATFILPIAIEAVNSIDSASKTEIENAKAEIQAEKNVEYSEENRAICEDVETDESVGLTD